MKQRNLTAQKACKWHKTELDAPLYQMHFLFRTQKENLPASQNDLNIHTFVLIILAIKAISRSKIPAVFLTRTRSL